MHSGGARGGSGGAASDCEDTRTDQDTNVSLGVELAPISPLELLNGGVGGGGGRRADGETGFEGDDLLMPDPPTVVIDSEDSPPTAKQKKIARVVMAVAFVLLAMCVILVGVTLSMSDHIDELVRKAQIHNGIIRPPPQGQAKPPTPTQNAGNGTVNATR